MKLSDYVILGLPLVIGSGSALIMKQMANETNKVSMRPCGTKSSLEPRPLVFSVAWTILFILQGVCGMLIWKHGSRRWSTSFKLWFILTLMLLLWWPLFVTWCNPSAAFVTILAILVLALVSVWKLWKVGYAGKLLIPLTIWLSFASYLAFIGIK